MRHLIYLSMLLPGLAVGSAQAGPLTDEQRADVVQILRDALRSDPSILRDALTAMQADDEARQSAAAATAITAQHAAIFADDADPVAGNPAGDVTVVEFYDPRCPYCRQMQPVIAALLHADPMVRLVYKDIPILGPGSLLDSRALLAAQRQGGYGRLQTAIMASTAPPSAASLRTMAEHEGLDGGRLEHDMADPAIQARIDRNLHLASALRLEGTPAIVIGDHLIPGAVGLQDLQRAVAAARPK